MRRAVVSSGRACDGACVFCAQDGLERDVRADASVVAALEDARAGGAAEVTFVGGEPGGALQLGEWVSLARALGFARVGVQTNGWELAAPGRVEALAGAGLTDVHLSVHGAEARVHDWHAGRAGAFDAAMRTLAAAQAAGLDVAVTTVVTRSSFRVLAPIPRLLASRGAGAWCAQIARWRGRAATHADSLVPRLALAVPFVLHALGAADALGLPAFVRGAPSCLLGPYASRAIEEDEARAFGEVCAACAARVACAGADGEYLARFGEEELSPRAAAAPDGRHGALRAMFVGVGEATPPLGRAADRARVSLPLMGRPLPAHREVAAGAPKKSGDALREILPDLFEPPKST
jgi:hypothetical protein